MSTVQSQIQSGTETALHFDPQQRQLQMNGRPDMLRQQGIQHLPQNMMNINSQHFLPPQQSQGQQPQPQPHMALLQNNNNPNPPMGLLAGAQTNVPPGTTNSQLYQLQMQQANAHRKQQLLLQQSQVAQGLPQQGGLAPGAHMNGLGHNQLQNMAFPNVMMQQQPPNAQIRRVVSQPHGLNPSAPHMAAMHPGQQSAPGMGMNGQGNIPNHMRQQHLQQQQMNMRLQQQQQQQHQQQQHQQQHNHQQQQPPLPGNMSPEMAMALNRQGHLQGNGGMPSNVARASSAQASMMPSLTQPSALAPAHSGGLQPPLQNSFPNAMNVPSQHHQPQLASSPRPGSHTGSHAQSHTPSNMAMTIPVPSQSANRSRLSPENNSIFMNLQNPPFPQNLQQHNIPRAPPNNNQFSFGSTSTPPGQDMSQPMAGGLAPGPSNRGNFHLTPAQQFEQMQQNPENYPSHFMPPPQSNGPARPPSQHNQHQTLSMPQQPQPPQHHHSPRQPDQMNMQPQRPQSQPQPQQVHHPTQQQVHPRTPRGSQPNLPANPGVVAPPRIAPGIPQPVVQQPPQQPAISAQLQPGPRPQGLVPPVPTSAPGGRAPPNPSEAGPAHAQPPVTPKSSGMSIPVGLGQGLIRLLQFSGVLAGDSSQKLQLKYWEGLVSEYFTSKAHFKFTLWKDNQRNEAKPFEIGVPIMPRFFLVTHQSGVKSMTLGLDGARERGVALGHAVIECISAVWTFKYTNGYSITLRGPLTAHIVVVPQSSTSPPSPMQYALKIDQIQFDANYHDKYVSLDCLLGSRIIQGDSPKTPRIRNTTISTSANAVQQRAEDDRRPDEPLVIIDRTTIPGEPVNAFGIPQATMRCLELAESVGQMLDLIQFSREASLGPLDALKTFAQKIRETQPHNLNPSGSKGPGSTSHSLGGEGTLLSGGSYPHTNGSGPSSSTLYPSAPTHNPPPAPSNQPQNPPSPSKQPKVVQQQPTSGPGPLPPGPPASQGASTPANNTPAMAHGTLKRKAQPSDNPSSATAASDPPPAKRVTRKRGRTTGGG